MQKPESRRYHGQCATVDCVGTFFTLRGNTVGQTVSSSQESCVCVCVSNSQNIHVSAGAREAHIENERMNNYIQVRFFVCFVFTYPMWKTTQWLVHAI